MPVYDDDIFCFLKIIVINSFNNLSQCLKTHAKEESSKQIYKGDNQHA